MSVRFFHNVCYFQIDQEFYVRNYFLKINYIIQYNCSGGCHVIVMPVKLSQYRGIDGTFDNRNFKIQT